MTLKRGSRNNCLSAARLTNSSTCGLRNAVKSESNVNEATGGSSGRVGPELALAGAAAAAVCGISCAAGVGGEAETVGADGVARTASSFRRDQRRSEKPSAERSLGPDLLFIAGSFRMSPHATQHRPCTAPCVLLSCALRG